MVTGPQSMPVFNDSNITPEQKQEMIARLTETMVEIEGEGMRGVTWAVIDEVQSGDWGIGGNGLTAADVHALQGRGEPRTVGVAARVLGHRRAELDPRDVAEPDGSCSRSRTARRRPASAATATKSRCACTTKKLVVMPTSNLLCSASSCCCGTTSPRRAHPTT